MKLSSAAITVATFSLLSSTHAAPLAFKNGEITGRLHHRRGSDLSEVSETFGSSKYDDALEDLDFGFEPGNLILPRILNFFKRQVSTAAEVTSSTAQSGGTENTAATSGTTDTDLHTTLMSPDLEEYGFASEGVGSALAPVREIKE